MYRSVTFKLQFSLFIPASPLTLTPGKIQCTIHSNYSGFTSTPCGAAGSLRFHFPPDRGMFELNDSVAI